MSSKVSERALCILIAVKTLDEALEISMEKVGEKARILVSPHGLTTVPILE